MKGSIVLPIDANGNQQVFLLSQVSNVVTVNTSISGITAPAVGFSVTGNGANFNFNAAFTFVNANIYTVAALINDLIINGSDQVTYILDVAPATCSLGVMSGSGPYIMTVTGTGLDNAAFVRLADGTQLSVNIPASTPTSVVTFASNYNPSPVPVTTVLDGFFNPLAAST